ncbi:MAG TPA: glycosyltransferase [Rhizomicrobium sp.]|nr:glycosyltransferase [Rhizomicrobium sp.]
MIVHNGGTRDGRVMREAHALQAAGHSVTVIGIPEASITSPEERLPDGVRVLRIAYDRSRIQKLILRAVALAPVALAAGYTLYRLYGSTVSLSGSSSGWRVASLWDRTALGKIVLIAALMLAFSYVLRSVMTRLQGSAARRIRENERLRREIISEDGDQPLRADFPAIRSRIPDWLPDWMLELLTAPLALLGTGFPNFSSYRYRSRRLASTATGLRPDVVHCHDCSALPTGWMVKEALNIPLIYDAHEIYEAVAARRLGATDYFARVHAKYLPLVDGFVAVNGSAARYYRHAYPTAPPAVVIRNATEHTPAGAYDGRLHRTAGLPPEQKILLYQGGFTRHRGLETLVLSARLLPHDWSLVMMGSGPLLETLNAILPGKDSVGKLHILPAVPAAELLSWTQGATVGIVPYEDTVLNHWIATPNKLWEYPNAGVPMIVQPFTEMRRIIETYGCGWVLPEAFSAGAIAGLVASLTPGMIDEARAGCHRFIEADNWTVYRARLLDLYRNLEAMVPTRNRPDRVEAAA